MDQKINAAVEPAQNVLIAEGSGAGSIVRSRISYLFFPQRKRERKKGIAKGRAGKKTNERAKHDTHSAPHRQCAAIRFIQTFANTICLDDLSEAIEWGSELWIERSR